MFEDIESCLSNSGFSSRFFKPSRGIRQGCCASPSLFLMVVELLASLIRQSPHLEGPKFGGSEIRLTQFADDLTCLLSNDRDLPSLLQLMTVFSSWSGLTVNRDKSKIISPTLLRENATTYMDFPVVSKTKILGIWIDVDRTEDASYQMNFREPLNRIRNVCEAWNNRNITIKGKVTIANSVLISILQYPCSIIHTPARVFKEYKKIVTHFLWSGKKQKIAYASLTQPISRGGLNLIDLDTRVKVNQIQWIRRIVARLSIACQHA